MSSASNQRAERISNIEVSAILRIGARARALQAEGHDVIVLGAGQPDYPTPDHVKVAAVEAIENNETQYTAIDGTLAMKQAVQQKFKRDQGLNFALDEIIVSTGAKQVLYNAFMATLNPGDEVIVPTPYWTSYSDIVRSCGAIPILLPTKQEHGFCLQAEDLKAAITDRTRWVAFNSPGNPSGAVYQEADYRPLLDILLDHPNIMIMADDIYEHIIYDDIKFVTPAQLEPGLRSRTLTVNGVSKGYAMTGWRLGYAGGPADLIKGMFIIQSLITSCPSSISQAAAIEALTGSQSILSSRNDSFQQRRDLVVSALNTMLGITCPSPSGAFYTFASCAGLLNKKTPDGQVIASDDDFCDLLLEQAKVAVVPGSAFGLSPFFRISYATSMDELEQAMYRMGEFIASLKD